ncbi:HSP20-like chaperone [Phaffia rhodozyma]|uniref:NudC domain-containing protein 1 n=1 Tax=Phaffia rhodozyma TaxID=264483 RepID=A0A0F7SIK3_PHARH|nr:HSP20-like chaperone [Phaffia rhodozyma]
MSSRSFPHNKAFSNPKFESYKLSRSEFTSTSFAVPGASISQRGVQHGKTPLSVREIQSRIHHDHLAVGYGGWMCWVDETWNIWAMKIGETFEPVFSPVCSLPVPVENDGSQPSEYPSITSVSPTTYLASDGRGRLYPVHVTPSATSLSGTLGPSYELLDPSSRELRPFKVEWVAGDQKILISSAKRTKLDDDKGWSREAGFDIMLVNFDHDDSDEMETDSTSIKELNIMWELHGKDAPIYVSFKSEHFLIGSSEHYSNLHSPSSSSDDTLLGSTDSQPRSEDSQTSFSWTQTSNSITISVPLPQDTPKSHIHISISPKHLTISLNSSSSSMNVFPPLPGFDRRAWWDIVRPDESFWQWEPSEGLLTIELEKTNTQTRWPHLFLPNSTAGVGDMADVEETLSDETRSAIAANLAKFTGPGPSNEELPSELPGGLSSLLRDDMDLDDDEREDGSGEAAGEDGERGGVGKLVKWSFIGGREEKNDVLEATKEEVKVDKLIGAEHVIGSELEWVRTGFRRNDNQGEEILVKYSLDALLFKPPSDFNSPFTHLKTFPALSFVLSSKRETKYILHTPLVDHLSPAKVLAFTSPTTEGAQGDLFIYQEAEGQMTAPSGVFKMGGGEEGALVGVKAVKISGEDVLIGLCEQTIVLLRGVL